MMPEDFYLARRQITVQGLITSALVIEFYEEQPDVVVPHELLDGGSVPIAIPFAVYPKQLLLDYSVQDQNGTRLSLLTKSASARITADHLMSLFPASAYERREVSNKDVCVLQLLEALATISPVTLSDRLARWERETGMGALRSARRLPLWLTYEAEDFKHGLSLKVQPLESRITSLLDYRVLDLGDRLPGGHQRRRAGSLGRFMSLSELLAFGVRDVLTITTQSRPEMHGKSADNRVIAADLMETYEFGLDGLSELLGRTKIAPLRRAIEREIANATVSWMAYIVAPVTVGVPFHIRASELLTLDRDRFCKRQLMRARTTQVYRIFPGDAKSTHIEVATGDVELTIKHRANRIVTADDIAVPRDAFAGEVQESVNMAHYYFSSDTSLRPLRNLSDVIELRIRYGLPRGVITAYGLATLAVLGAALYAPIALRDARDDGVAQANVVALGSAFVALLIFFMTAQHKKPLVLGKLEVARWFLYAGLIALGAAPLWRLLNSPF